MEMDLVDLHIVKGSPELPHGTEVEAIITLVCSLINKVEIPTDEERQIGGGGRHSKLVEEVRFEAMQNRAINDRERPGNGSRR